MEDNQENNINTQEVEKDPAKPNTKRPLNNLNVTLDEIKRVSLLRFGSYSKIGREFGGLGKVYAWRILNGQIVIKSDKTIEKIAKALGVPFLVLRDLLPKDINKK